MKGRNLLLISALVLAAGIILLIARNSIGSDAVVTVGGVLFILAAVFNIIASDSGHRRKKDAPEESRGMISSAMGWIASVAAIILGICMLVFKSTFTPLVPVMFGILVAFSAFYQLYILAIGVRPVVLPAWLYFAPLILAMGAAYLFFQEGLVDDLRIVLITAVSLIVFGVSGIIEGSMLGNENRLMKKEGASTPEEARRLRDERRQANGKPNEPADAAPSKPDVSEPAEAGSPSAPEEEEKDTATALSDKPENE